MPMSSSDYELEVTDPHYFDSAGRHWGIGIILKINIIVSSLSFAGSLIMIIPFLLSKQLRKIRHRLILGMAVNDALQALAVLIPSVWSTSHGTLKANSPGCNADSFFYLTHVVAGCFWTLAIAITTYITLVQPMSKLAHLMHKPSSIYFIWVAIWLICFTNAGIGTALNLSVDGGGFCFFPMVMPWLYGNLVLFVPRAATFIIIILIYVRLSIFFRQQASSHREQESGLHNSSFSIPMSSPAMETDLEMLSTGRDTLGTAVSKQTSNMSERQTAAALQLRFAQYKISPSISRKSSGDTENSGESSKRRCTPSVRMPADESDVVFPLVDVSGLLDKESVAEGYTRRERAWSSLQDSSAILNSEDGFEAQINLHGQCQEKDASAPESPAAYAPTYRNSSTSSVLSSPPLMSEKTSAEIVSSADQPNREDVQAKVSIISPGQDSSLTLTSNLANPFDRLTPGSDHTAIATPPTDKSRSDSILGLWEALGSVDPADSDDQELADACAEKGRRLSASEENRRVSYLMLLYPLAYGFILAISIARLTVTLITKASPSPWLQILNRVVVQGTGVVDAVIYTIIEWRFRASSQSASRSRQASDHEEGHTKRISG